MLNLVIADTSLETIPIEIFQHTSLKKIRNSGKKPNEILLDRTFHHFAILANNLKDDYKRGRPDILHIILLNVLATPLFKKNQIKVFVHTINNQVIKIGDNLRIPKSYSRYEGLMVDLIKNKKIVSKDGNLLLELIDYLSFADLIQKHIMPDVTTGFSTRGILKKFEYVSNELFSLKNPCVVIGGFPKGHFSKDVEPFVDKMYSISNFNLEAHVVVSRLLYEWEKINDFR
ncbi:MAG: ribosome biogenesis protein [Nitrosopumilus sp.]|nr:ribosome biogenesis protein [Nitrosopumilus sp.]